ncbi:hypothetical protein FB446DRAFT_703848 [Lentinula raphanica]|nr:hypothetical protein FB446DRAFT_703848 [Lentinula raphanica]
MSNPRVPRFEGLEYSRLSNRIGYEASRTLAKHIPFISDPPQPDYCSPGNYAVCVDPHDPLHHIVEDHGREFSVRVPTMLLLKPEFNLPAWYQRCLEKAERDLLQRLSGPIEYEFLTRFFYGDPVDDFERELDQMVQFSEHHLHLAYGNLVWEE